jgi:hypothetical protein
LGGREEREKCFLEMTCVPFISSLVKVTLRSPDNESCFNFWIVRKFKIDIS